MELKLLFVEMVEMCCGRKSSWGYVLVACVVMIVGSELVEASVVVVTELLETSEMMQNNAEALDKKITSFSV